MNQETDTPLVTEYVALALRSEATIEQLLYLKDHQEQWLTELIALKRKTETQMTSSRTRSFSLHVKYQNNDINRDKFNEEMLEEKVWRTNATRFLQQVEGQIAELKHGQNRTEAP